MSTADVTPISAGPLPPNIATAARPGSGALRARDVPSPQLVPVSRPGEAAPLPRRSSRAAHPVPRRPRDDARRPARASRDRETRSLSASRRRRSTTCRPPARRRRSRLHDHRSAPATSRTTARSRPWIGSRRPIVHRPRSSSRPRNGVALSTVKSDGVTDARSKPDRFGAAADAGGRRHDAASRQIASIVAGCACQARYVAFVMVPRTRGSCPCRDSLRRGRADPGRATAAASTTRRR